MLTGPPLGLRKDIALWMPAVVFKRALPDRALLAGLGKFPHLLRISCGGSATPEVLAKELSLAGRGSERGLRFDIR